jgi:hypothetical protein
MAVFSWLEGWYNPYRRHSSLGYRSPMNYERLALSRIAACNKAAKVLCRPQSGDTATNGHPSIVAPWASYAFGFSHHAANPLPLTRQTALLVPTDKKPGSENPGTKRRSIISTAP